MSFLKMNVATRMKQKWQRETSTRMGQFADSVEDHVVGFAALREVLQGVINDLTCSK